MNSSLSYKQLLNLQAEKKRIFIKINICLFSNFYMNVFYILFLYEMFFN